MKLKNVLPSSSNRFKMMERWGERTNPFAVMRQEMNRLFERLWDDYTPLPFESGWKQSYPSVDVKETEKAITVTAELSGIDKKDVDISVDQNTLMIRGIKQQEKEEKRGGYTHQERAYGAFHRTIPFPCDVKSETAKASFKNGLLKVEIQKKPGAQQLKKKIEIQS